MIIIINKNNKIAEGFAPTVYITFFYWSLSPKKLSHLINKLKMLDFYKFNTFYLSKSIILLNLLVRRMSS